MMETPVISNAGPLMVLSKLNLLHLLQQLYGQVYFSQTVYSEVVQAGVRLGYQDAYTAQQFLRALNWDPVETFSLPYKGVRGTLGILIEAYRQNLITEDQLRLYFHQIITRSDIWISSSFAVALLNRVLKAD